MDDSETLYRIEYTIQRKLPGEEDFTDVGFGSSGGWASIDAASHMVSSAIDNQDWETEPGMPPAKEIR